MQKKTLAIFSLTSCEGCQFEALNNFEAFSKLLQFFDIKNFRLGQEENLPGPFDIALVEGSPEGKEQIKLLREIRKSSKLVVIIGACAHLGGIQSERNFLPAKLINKEKIKNVSSYIKVDFLVPGCPINHKELYRCLLDLYWGKIFTLPDLAVCFECRQNENDCLLKEGKPCLGPVTRSGCNSICINNGESCLGCRGTTPQPNILKMREILGTMMTEDEIDKLLSIYGRIDQNSNLEKND